MLTESDLIRGICCGNIKQQLLCFLRVSEQMLALLQRISEIHNKQQRDDTLHQKHKENSVCITGNQSEMSEAGLAARCAHRGGVHIDLRNKHQRGL